MQHAWAAWNTCVSNPLPLLSMVACPLLYALGDVLFPIRTCILGDNTRSQTALPWSRPVKESRSKIVLWRKGKTGSGWTLLRVGRSPQENLFWLQSSVYPLACYKKHEKESRRMHMNSVSERWSMPPSPQSCLQQLVACMVKEAETFKIAWVSYSSWEPSQDSTQLSLSFVHYSGFLITRMMIRFTREVYGKSASEEVDYGP